MSSHVCQNCKSDVFTLVNEAGRKLFECMSCGSREHMARKWVAPTGRRVWEEPRESLGWAELKGIDTLIVEWAVKWERLINQGA